MNSRKLAQNLVTLTERTSSIDEAVDMFWQFMEERNLVGYAPSIMQHLRYLHQQSLAANSLKINSRHELDADTITAIKTALEVPDQVPVSTTIDTTVIGGFVAEYQGRQYDASLAQSAHRLANQLTQA